MKKILCFTGLIQFNIGTSNSVEAAINFLYGQRPKITEDNVESILEVAEFLMMEELKALCIKKLKSFQVDANNCLKLLLWTSRYDIYLEKLSNYILSHLQDLLLVDELLLLDKDSVRYVISDPLLAYISREDCLKYIIRWTSHSAERCSDFADLWASLDKQDISPDVLTTANLDNLSEDNRLLCYSLSAPSNSNRNVIIAYPPQYHNSKYFLYVYCMDKKVWYQLLGGDPCKWPNRPGVTLMNQHLVVNTTSYPAKITYHDLYTRNTVEKDILVDGNTTDEITTFDHVSAIEDKIFCIKNKVCYTAHPDTDSEDDEIEVDLIDFIRIQAMCGGNEQLAYSLIAAGRRIRRQAQETCTCTLFMSAGDTEGDTIDLKALISVKGTVTSLSVQDGIACLLIPERKQMIIFAYDQLSISKLDLSSYSLDGESYLCPCRYGGFYTVTKSHILQIEIRLNDSSIAANISEGLIPKQENVDEFWSSTYPIKLEVLQDAIVVSEKHRDNYENKLSYQNLPETIGFLNKEEKIDMEIPDRMKHENSHFLQTTLPKERLRCPIGCPHCQFTTRAQYPAYERDSDSDEYVYFDDSDGYYGYYDSSD